MTFSHRFLRLLAVPSREVGTLFMRYQFLRYVLVGIANTAFSYGVYAALLLGGLDFRVASLLALLLGVVFSFATHGTLVFRQATRITFVKFVIAWTLIYAFNITLIALLMRASIDAYISGAIATVPVTLVSYFILKFAVFGRALPLGPIRTTK